MAAILLLGWVSSRDNTRRAAKPASVQSARCLLGDASITSQVTGQCGIRKLRIVGAMSVIKWVVRRGGSTNRWLASLVARKPRMVAAVALAYLQAQMLARHLRGDIDADPPWF